MSKETATFDFSNLQELISVPEVETKNEIVIADLEPVIAEPKVEEIVSPVVELTDEITPPIIKDEPKVVNTYLKDIVKGIGITSVFYPGENEDDEDQEVSIDDLELDLEQAIEFIKSSHQQEIEEIKQRTISLEDVDNNRKEIIDFIAKGGDPKALIEYQSTIEEVKQYDLDDENDAEEVIRKYYSIKGDTSKEEVDIFITGAKAQGTLTSMAEKASSKILEFVEKKKEEEKEFIETHAKNREEALKTYIKGYKTKAKTLSGYNDKQISKIIEFGTKQVSKKGFDGSDVKTYELDEAIHAMRNNPELAVELAAFVMDKELYLKTALIPKEIELKKELSKKVRVSRLATNSASLNTTPLEAKRQEDFLIPLG